MMKTKIMSTEFSKIVAELKRIKAECHICCVILYGMRVFVAVRLVADCYTPFTLLLL